MQINSRVTIVFSLLGLCLFSLGLAVSSAPGQSPGTSKTERPINSRSWIDPDTGHRIIRLTDQPGSLGMYFTDNAFTPDGREMIYVAARNIYVVDLNTQQSRRLVTGPVREVVVSRTSPTVYFMRSNDQALYSADVSDGDLKQILMLPPKANISTINADGTFLAGTYLDGSGPDLNHLATAAGIKPSKKAKERVRFDAHLPMGIFVVNLKTATVAKIFQGNTWLNHVQFSPVDPNLLMYCHEGPWNEVDRIWTIRSDGTENRLVHHRTLPQKEETAGHEFWDADGKTVWFDLQAPKGKAFFLASYNTATGTEQKFQMNRNQWSIHFNGDLQSGIFCGDGASYYEAASAPDGQWIELYHLHVTSSAATSSGAMYQNGAVESERLVNLAKQDYELEPNVHLSPDHKFVIFTSNMLGPSYIFAVEIARADGAKPNTQVFSPTIKEIPDSDPLSTVQVVDSTGTPLANEDVSIKSLDTGKEVGQFVTDGSGKTTPTFFDKDLHRFSVTCPDGRCGATIQELYTPPFSGNIVIHTQPTSSIRAYQANTKKTKIVLQGSTTADALAKVDVLARTQTADQETWSTTDGNGAANIVVPADPSIVTVFVKWTPYVYEFSSDCGANPMPGVLKCVSIGETVTLQIPRP